MPASIEGGAFSDKTVSEIANAIGLTDDAKIRDLAERLSTLPGLAASFRTLDAAGPPSTRVEALGAVARSCAAVLETFAKDEREIARDLRRDVMVPQIIWSLALEIDPAHPEWAIRDRKADQCLNECLNAVRRLKTAARDGAARAETEITPGRGGKRRKPDRVQGNIALELFYIYEVVTGRKVGTSIHTESKEPTGPLIRMFRLCLPELGWDLSPKAIRALIERVRKHPSRLPASI